MEHYENEEEIDLNELFNIIKRNIIVILGVAFVAGVVGFLFTTLLVDKEYVSDGMIIVNNRKQDGASNITNDEINSAKGLTSVYSIIIKSDPVLETVKTNLNLSMTISELRSTLSINSVDGTQVMNIKSQTKDAKLSAAIVNEILGVAHEFLIEKVEAGSVQVVSPAKVNSLAVSPNPKRNSVLMFAVALMGMSGIFIVISLLDKSIKSEQDLENHLGVPILGVIPNVDSVRGPSK